MAAKGEQVEITKSEIFDVHYGTQSGFCAPAAITTSSCSIDVGSIHKTQAESSHGIENENFLTDGCGDSKSLSNTLPAKISSFDQFLDDWLNDGREDEPSDDEDLLKSAEKLQVNEHSGTLFKVDRYTLDLTSRFAKYSGDAFVTYSDSNEQVQKERIHSTSITSIQRFQPHKHRSDVLLYCFEVNLVPKKGSKSSYIFGSPEQVLIMTWLRILAQAMTPAFTDANVIQTCSIVGGGYVKKALDSEWSPASIMLTRRRSLLWTLDTGGHQTVDFRKVKSINHVEDDVIVVETPDDTLQFKLLTAQESTKWRSLIKKSALQNGDRLQSQQLTRDDVPVVVERCIDFIFAYGLRAEGVYRKSGSTAQIQKLLAQFKLDAHSVRLCPTDYNVHTIAGCLKKFLRDLPTSLIGDLSICFIGVSKLETEAAKTEAYVELLQRLPKIEYQTLRKIVGHLNFVQSQAEHNRMTSQNLAIVWGSNLLRDPQTEDTEYSKEEANVVQDLIDFYKDVFHPTFEELEENRKLLTMLEQYYALHSDLPNDDNVDVIDNLKVWIKYTESPDARDEDKAMYHITLTSCKTVYDICKEIAAHVNFRPDQLTLSELILDNYLERPLHHEEIVLDTVLRWADWAEDDRRNNHLEMRLAGLFTELASQPEAMPQNSHLKFADLRTKVPGLFTVALLNDSLRILKQSKHEYEIHKELVLRDYSVYLGCEKRRSLTPRSWGITFLSKCFQKRTRDEPYIGHMLAGTDMGDQLAWYSAILYNLHGNNLFPVLEKA